MIFNRSLSVSNAHGKSHASRGIYSTPRILTLIGGISLYFLDSSHPGACYFGISGICFLALFPWTKFKIMPINNALMDESALKKNDEWINDMIDNWGRVHFVRTVLGGIAFALNIRAILM